MKHLNTLKTLGLGQLTTCCQLAQITTRAKVAIGTRQHKGAHTGVACRIGQSLLKTLIKLGAEGIARFGVVVDQNPDTALLVADYGIAHDCWAARAI